MAYELFDGQAGEPVDLWSLPAREQEEALRKLLTPFSGKVFFKQAARRELHISRALGRHQRLGELIFWAHAEALAIVWHEPLAFEEQFSRASTQTRLRDNAVQRYVVGLFEAAYARRAQDIHIIHSGRSTLIRMRILGDLVDYEQKDAAFGEQMMALIYNCFAQQTGRAVFSHLLRLDGRIINPQVLPAGVFAARLHAEPIQTNARDAGLFMTLRLLYDATEASGSLDERLRHLGFLPEQIAQISHLLRRGGLSLVSGATGHGKSTVLKHIFEAMVAARPEQSYLSVEDPPEYRILGVNQIQVQTAEGKSRAASYREALAGALRSDPDVLMIGEIRYAEAAHAAITCALSGHAVWATLHADGALACVTRLEGLLEELGKSRAREWILNPCVLSGLCHLRLLPVLCPDCKRRASEVLGRKRGTIGSEAEACLLRAKKMLGRQFSKVFVRGPGCRFCQGRGTVAMTLAAEVVVLEEHLREALLQGQLALARQIVKGQGSQTAWEVACQKMLLGLVDPRDCEMRLNSQIPL